MKLYTVHYRTESTHSLAGLSEQAEFVKEGFCWPALLIPPVWFVMKRMWWVLAAYLVITSGLSVLSAAKLVPAEITTIISFGFNVILGFEGYELYRWSLARRRMPERAVVHGDSRTDAEQRFFRAMDAQIAQGLKEEPVS